MRLYSIISPVYNTGNYLDRCIHSVLKQTYQNWELILVDDGSTDRHTIELCDYYAGMDPRIKVIHKSNEGLLLTRRVGMKAARGEYLCALDSDDYLNSHMLQTVNKAIDRTNCDMVIFRLQHKKTRLNRRGPKLHKHYEIISEGNKDELLRGVLQSDHYNNMCTKVVSRELAKIDTDYSQYRGLTFGEDLLQSIPMLFTAHKICYLNRALYYYVNNPSSITNSAVKHLKYRQRTHDIMALDQCIRENIKQYYPERTVYYEICTKKTVNSYLSNMRRYALADHKLNEDYLQFLEEEQNRSGMRQYCSQISAEDVSPANRKIWKMYCSGNLKEYITNEYKNQQR